MFLSIMDSTHLQQSSCAPAAEYPGMGELLELAAGVLGGQWAVLWNGGKIVASFGAVPSGLETHIPWLRQRTLGGAAFWADTQSVSPAGGLESLVAAMGVVSGQITPCGQKANPPLLLVGKAGGSDQAAIASAASGASESRGATCAGGARESRGATGSGETAVHASGSSGELNSASRRQAILLAGQLAQRMALVDSLGHLKSAAVNRDEALWRTRRSEDRFRQIFECGPLGMALVDDKGICLDVNEKLCRLLGWRREELCGKSLAQFMPADQAQVTARLADELLAGKIPAYQHEKQYYRRDGRRLWVRVTASAARGIEGQPPHVIVSFEDIHSHKTEEMLEQRRRATLEMVAQNLPLEQVLGHLVKQLGENYPDALPAGLFLRNGRMEWLADGLDAACMAQVESRGLGLSVRLWEACGNEEQLLSMPLEQSNAWGQQGKVLSESGYSWAWSEPILSSQQEIHGFMLLLHRQPRMASDSDVAIMRMNARLASLAIGHATLTDRLAYHAQHDALTGLANRTLFEDRLRRAVAAAESGQARCAVIYIDLDGFKLVNDTLGHQAGDDLLREVAHRLQLRTRQGDTLARLGGDEFALCLSSLHLPIEVTQLGRRLLEELRRPIELNGREIFISASMGAAIYPDDGTDQQTLSKNADTAMYWVKGQGRNNLARYQPKMNAEARRRLELVGDLRNALDHDELQLHYQLQYDALGAPVSCEALLRWNHPTLGMIPPLQFIPLAEETGLIVPIGLWVLRQACQQTHRWRQNGMTPLVMAVNVSAMQFAQADFVQQVRMALEDYCLAPSDLELELTESLLMHNTADAADKLNELRTLGVRLAIDDFGTGYSSLSYLHKLPIDTLKIDRSFVAELDKPDSGRDTAIVRAIIALAQSLGLDLVAEGVETQTQRNWLQALGCQRFQGYLLAKPQPAAEVEALLSAAARQCA